MPVPSTLVREAFDRAGEKRFLLARCVYPALLGAHWAEAVLGYAYLKCLDDLVDEDRDSDRALAVLSRQRCFIDRVYEGGATDAAMLPERFGLPFFTHDRDCGGALRRPFEAIVATMEFDTQRRGRMLDAAALDAYVVELGVAVLRFFLHFAAPDAAPPLRFLRLGSRAYLYADALIDLRHDLDFGVINVPREDVERYGLSLDMADPRLRRWVAERGAAILVQFDEALGQSRRLERWSLRASAHLFLSTKRRKLRRFLQREGLLVARAQPATDLARRPTFRDGAAGPPGGG